jgi:hypothetical protein
MHHKYFSIAKELAKEVAGKRELKEKGCFTFYDFLLLMQRIAINFVQQQQQKTHRFILSLEAKSSPGELWIPGEFWMMQDWFFVGRCRGESVSLPFELAFPGV